MNFFRRVWRFVRDLLRRKPRAFRVRLVTEVPDVLAEFVLYIEGEGGAAWVAVMLCPCGCCGRITLNLLSETHPCWEIVVHPDGTPSVRPSVWRTVGCRSHFFVHRGHIDWC